MLHAAQCARAAPDFQPLIFFCPVKLPRGVWTTLTIDIEKSILSILIIEMYLMGSMKLSNIDIDKGHEEPHSIAKPSFIFDTMKISGRAYRQIA